MHKGWSPGNVDGMKMDITATIPMPLSCTWAGPGTPKIPTACRAHIKDRIVGMKPTKMVGQLLQGGFWSIPHALHLPFPLYGGPIYLPGRHHIVPKNMAFYSTRTIFGLCTGNDNRTGWTTRDASIPFPPSTTLCPKASGATFRITLPAPLISALIERPSLAL
jgi:hypothetical protein